MIRVTLAILLLSQVLASAADCCGDITARAITWRPGVRGGITNYPICNSIADYGAVGDGTTDNYGAFTNAIAHCTNGGAVRVPAGTYAIAKSVTIAYPKSIVIRGDNRETSIIKATSASDSSGHMIFAHDFSRNTYVITSATAGQSNIVLTSVAGISVGQYALIRQSNDTAVVFGHLSSGATNSSSWWQGQMFQITNISGTTLTVDRPIYPVTYSSTWNYKLDVFTACVAYSGLEDLTVWVTDATTDRAAVFFGGAANCWLKNCILTNSQNSEVDTWWAYALEIRECRIENHQVYDSNARYAISLNHEASDCLVEFNILQGHNICVSVQQGATGNVIGYNFCDRGWGLGFPTDTGTIGGINSHGDNACFNLYEGNVVPYIQHDEFWGENNHETDYRNWLTRYAYYNTTTNISQLTDPALFVDSTNYNMTTVGNVLGAPRNSGGASSSYQIGWKRGGSSVNDFTVSNSWFNHLNFDFRNGTVSTSNGISTTLCNSLYLTNKPTWFSNLAWPPIGPDISASTNNSITNTQNIIPAQAMYYKIDFSSPAVGPQAPGLLNVSGRLNVGQIIKVP